MTPTTSYLLTPLDAQSGMFVNTIPIMRAISHEIEDIVLQNKLYVDLFAGFQRFSLFAIQAKRYRQLAQVCRTIYVWGIPDVDPPHIPNVKYVSLSPDMEIAREWFLVVDSPEFFTALIAEEKTYDLDIPKEERLFEGIWTYNPERVGQAATMLAESLAIPYTPVAQHSYEAQSYHLAHIFARLMQQRERSVIDKVLVQHRQALFESGLASSETPLLLLDTDKTVIAASKTACAILGEDMAQIVGRPLRECGNGLFARRDPTRVFSDMMALLSVSGDDLLAATCKPIQDTRERLIGWVVHLHYVNHYHVRVSRPRLPITGALQPYCNDIRQQIANLTTQALSGDTQQDTIQQTQRLLYDLNQQIQRIALLDELEAQGEVAKNNVVADRVVQPVVVEQQRTADAHGLVISLTAPDKMPMLWCNVDQVRLAVRELLENVFRHARGCDAVSIRCGVESGYTTLVVEDNGQGVDPDIQYRLSQSFYHAQPAPAANERVGLGLALVRAIASAHHGYFRIESIPGQGTACTLMLPLNQ